MLDVEEPMTDKHHYQRIDVENGYIQITRDDTDETQELRINAYGKDGTLIKSARYLYNIQYDYFRRQTWKGAALIQDEIPLSCGYGHLQWEFGAYPPEGWKNPYPDNYEPINPKGTYIFRHHGGIVSFSCVELCISVYLNISGDELDEDRKDALSLVNKVDWLNPLYTDDEREAEQKAIRNFDPEQARRQRIEGIKLNTQYLRCELEKPDYQNAVKAAHAKEIDIEIPLDPRFID